MTGGSGVRLFNGPYLKLFILVGWGLSYLSVAWPIGAQLEVFFFHLLRISVSYLVPCLD